MGWENKIKMAEWTFSKLWLKWTLYIQLAASFFTYLIVFSLLFSVCLQATIYIYIYIYIYIVCVRADEHIGA